MLIKVLLFLLALTAHSWLWGQWSLESTLRTSLLLIVATLLLLIIVGMPIRSLVKKQSLKVLFQAYWMRSCFYGYMVLVIIMGLFSFTGLIQILLPIKVLLLASYAGLRFYFKKIKSKNVTPAP